MTDSLKFGPEWLRNLSGDSCNSGSGGGGGGGGTANLITPRYQLAEHRYGREEMLALFDRNCKPPENLLNFQTIFVDKTQLPLAFIPETEDETRVRNIGVGSTGLRGRGGSVDRGGRLRTSRGGMYSHYRDRGYDDSGDGIRLDSQSYPSRNRNFERSQSERGWTERNGILDSNDWNGSTSPRKELGRGTSGSSLMESNWRRHRTCPDEEEGWRIAPNNRGEKWIRGSWRDGGGSERDRLDRPDTDGDDNRSSGRWEIRTTHRSSHDSHHHHHHHHHHHPPPRTSRTWDSNNHHDNHDNLPEWATENPGESGGSFDALGAFHGGMFSDEDDDGGLNKDNRMKKINADVSNNTSSNNSRLGNKSSPYGNNINQNSTNRSSTVTTATTNSVNTSNKDKIKSINLTDDKEISIPEKQSNNNMRNADIGVKNSSTDNDDDDEEDDDDDDDDDGGNDDDDDDDDEEEVDDDNDEGGDDDEDGDDDINDDVHDQSHNQNQKLSSSIITSKIKTESNNLQLPPQRSKSFIGISNKVNSNVELKIDHPKSTVLLNSTHESISNENNSLISPPSPTKITKSLASVTATAITTTLTAMPSSLSSVATASSSKTTTTTTTFPSSSSSAATTVVKIKQKTDDDLDRMKEEADMLVAKLMADEEIHREIETMPSVPSLSTNTNQEKWFYRDPQGEVQGPFLASEMADWCKSGYFTPGLFVRRTCDERYTTLGDLMKLCGRVPFIPGPLIPPIKLNDPVLTSSPSSSSPSPSTLSTVSVPIPIPVQVSVPPAQAATPISNTGIPGSALPKPGSGLEDPLFMLQYQQLRMMHNQQLLLRQMKATAIAKLSQSEHWNTLTPVEQNQLIMQCIMQETEFRDLSMAANPFVPPPSLVPPQSNPVMQLLFNQMQQIKTQNENHLPPNPHPHPHPHSHPHPHPHSHSHSLPHSHPHTHTHPHPHPHPPTGIHGPPIDPIQQLMQQISGIQNIPGANLHPSSSQPVPTQTPPPPSVPVAPPVSAPTQDDDPIKSLLRQLHGHTIDSIWPQPTSQINPQFNAQNWLAQVGPLPAVPPGQISNSLWDSHIKEMKTEQQILEEQNIRLQEDRKKEELRKQEEMQRIAEDKNIKRKLEEEEEKKKKQQKQREEEERLKEEEKRRQDLEEQRKREEKKKKEEEKRREEKRKQEEENNKKKQLEEEKKKREEKLKKEEEKKRKLEEEQKRIEEEKIKKENEIKKRVETEEQVKKVEQRRREAEALKKLQERSKAPWAQSSHTSPTTAHASLAEIQKLEREKKAEEQRYQQLMQQQLAQQALQQKTVEAAANDSLTKRLQFKWAEKVTPINKQPQVKSLIQIQQEEQEQLAKIKQQEKERQDKVNQQQKESLVLQNAGIWGTASQSLNWSTNNTNNDLAKGANKTAWSSGGFWDEPPTPPKFNLSKQTIVKSSSSAALTSTSNTYKLQTNQQQTITSQQQNSNKNNNINNNNGSSKSKAKKEEDVVKKIFENSAKTDDFTQWCNRTLCGLQTSVDIPTFIGFLRDIESAYEVKEYVRMYLGDNKQCTEFARQFLEKRSKWRSSQRPQAEADDLCKPAPAVNPNAPTEFQEVKGKSKKPKKGKMFKVDNRILGFSVTAATDRINVGDRDYGEGV